MTAHHFRAALGAFVALAALAGCNGEPRQAANGAAAPLRVAYLGLTCEAAIFVAHERGFFRDEGLEVQLVKTDWDGLREGVAGGQFDANYTLIMYLLKAVEQNADLKIVGGIHTGCLRVQVPVNSPIKSAVELRGKRIGVPTHIGSPPHMFASRVLVAHGIEPSQEAREVTWLAFPPDVLGKAVEDDRVDAIATSDPIGTILVGKGLVRTIADQALDPPYSLEYCCAVVVNGRLARDNPEAAGKLTRAMLKGAKWVEENPLAAAELSVAKKYVASTVEVNALALAQLRFIPGVDRCRRSIETAAAEMKKAKLLKDSTDLEVLRRRAWLDLPGVTDEWVAAVHVERVPGGRPAPLEPKAFAALFDKLKPCCGCCCSPAE